MTKKRTTKGTEMTLKWTTKITLQFTTRDDIDLEDEYLEAVSLAEGNVCEAERRALGWPGGESA